MSFFSEYVSQKYEMVNLNLNYSNDLDTLILTLEMVQYYCTHIYYALQTESEFSEIAGCNYINSPDVDRFASLFCYVASQVNSYIFTIYKKNVA